MLFISIALLCLLGLVDASGLNEVRKVSGLNEVRKVSEGNSETDLREFLFRNYKYQNRPVLNYSDTVTASFGVELMSLEEFDQVGEKVKFNFHMKFTWYDEFLRWDLSQYNFNYLNLKPDILWRPDLELYNSANKPEKVNGEGILKVFHTGQVYWVIPILYDYSCPLTLSDFPFDTQKCIMIFGSWKLSQNYLNISTHPINTPNSIANQGYNKQVMLSVPDIFGPESRSENNISSPSILEKQKKYNTNNQILFSPVAYDKFKHNEWNIVNMEHYNENIEYLCCPGELWTIAEIHIIMERNYHKYIVVILMTFFLTCSSITVTLFTLERYIRTYLLVFIPLSIIWLQLYISSKIPVIEYPTTMENFIQLSYYICMISAIYSGIIFNIANYGYGQENKIQMPVYLLDKWISKNIIIKKPDNISRKIHLDYGFFSDLLFNVDNVFRSILISVYFLGTIIILNL